MEEFVSEPIEPLRGTFETSAMSRGEPGLPSGFRWHGEPLAIEAVLERWKQSAPAGNSEGQIYLRRHWYRLRMSDASVWEVYVTRQASRSGNPRRRWFLYARRTQSDPPAAPEAESRP